MIECWSSQKLGDVCDFEGGSQPPKSQFLFEEKTGYERFLQIRDFGSDKNITYIPQSKKNRLCNNDDILIGRYGASVGKIVTNKSGAYNVALMKTIPNLEVVNKSWFYYYLISNEFQERLLNVADRSAQAGFSKDDIYNFPIPTPHRDEQQRIVAILDEAFDGIATAKANAEKNLKNARELFESHLQSVFTQRGNGWEEKSLSDICTIKHGFAFKSEFFTASGDYVLLTPGNFYESGGYRDRGEKQKFYTGQIPQDYVLSEGDLLVAMTEQAAGLLGSSILVPESNKFLHNQRLGLVVKKPDIPWLNEFFFHVFNTKFVRKEIHDSATGVKVRHTSPTKMGDVLVSFPTSIEEQTSIVQTLEKLIEETQRLEAIYQQKITALDELKKSLLHKAFSGEL
jgi:type I restriction enzyme S subunit